MLFSPRYLGPRFMDVSTVGQVSAQTSQAATGFASLQVATNDQIATQLTSGYWNGDVHHWAVTQGGTLTVNISSLNSTEQTLALAALSEWTDVIGVTFQPVLNGGQIVFDDSEDPSGPIAATDATWSNGIMSSAHVHVSTSWVTTNGPGLDSYSFQTYVHEIGHALGLGHPGNYNDTAGYLANASFANDAWSTSVMSYFDQHENYYFSNQGFSRLFALTPMVADIVAMQSLYGLSTTTRTGDTTYGYHSNAGGIYDASLYPAAAYTIYDSGGNDTIDYSASSASQLININPETYSNVNGYVGNLEIARGVVIENAIGGAGADTIIQNSANNVLDGGAGNNTVSYETAAAGVTVNLGLTTAQNTGGAGIDTLSNFQNLIGSAFGDDLIGGPTTVSISGGAGDDRIEGGTSNVPAGIYETGGDGNDTFVLGAGPFRIDGGAGLNIVDGSHAPAGLVLVTNGQAPGQIDSIYNCQEIIGSNYNDNLTATRSGDILMGGPGDDILTSYGGGTLIGGVGNDTYIVLNTTDQIVENAGEGIDTVKAACNYTLGANLENLTLHENLPWDPYASAAYSPTPPPENWSATGNDLANVIIGNLGDNVITGGLGADTLTGGGGHDTFLDTEAGHDGDTITDFSVEDKITFSDATLGSFTFSLSGHTLVFSGGSLTLVNLPSGTLAASMAPGGGVQLMVAATTIPPSQHAAHNDFNGDGLSDILWQNDSGLTTDWLDQSNGGFVGNSANFLSEVDPSWHIVGTGDFNGDGRADLLWQNNGGLTTDWLAQANGGFYGNSSNFLTQVDPSWHVVGMGDFNGDGRTDLLWRNNSGQVTDWISQADGGFFGNSSNFLSQFDTSWHVAGTGDFNGDGIDDILWRKDDGTVADWLGQTNGSFVPNSSNLMAQVGTSWHIAATGDFNGDGLTDILWVSDSGLVTDWLAQSNGGFYGNAGTFLSPVDPTWHVVETGDFNGDAIDDILWRKPDGSLVEWLAQPNGAFIANANFHAQVDNSWHVQPQETFL